MASSTSKTTSSGSADSSVDDQLDVPEALIGKGRRRTDRTDGDWIYHDTDDTDDADDVSSGSDGEGVGAARADQIEDAVLVDDDEDGDEFADIDSETAFEWEGEGPSHHNWGSDSDTDSDSDSAEDSDVVEDSDVDPDGSAGGRVPLAAGFLSRRHYGRGSGRRTDPGLGLEPSTSAPSPIQRIRRAATGLGVPHRLVGGPKPIGGVAPFIQPRNRVSRWIKARELVGRGYVPLSPGRPKLRHRILPRSVIGIATMLMMLGVGAAFSGAAFYAYYDARLADNERAVARFVDSFDQQFNDATGAIDGLRADTINEIRDEMKPLGEYVADANGVIELPEAAGPSVWMVETRDEEGRLTAGAAFAVVEHDGGTALITSYSLVSASTVEPAPGIDLIKNSTRIPGQLWSWDVDHDLAVVVVDQEIPVLEFATEQAQLESVGSRLFALSGMGGNGSTASPGVLLDQSQIGLQHTVPVGTLFVGGPLLNSQGRVVGVASTNYRPLGIDPGDVAQAPDVRSMCAVVLQCSQVQARVVIDVTADAGAAPESDGTPVRGGDPTDEAATEDAEDAATESDTENVVGDDAVVDTTGTDDGAVDAEG